MNKNIILVDQDAAHAKGNCPRKECRSVVHESMEQLYGHMPDVGTVVYLSFIDTTTGLSENLWVRVTSRGTGVLDNDPERVDMKCGDLVEFENRHIKDIMTSKPVEGLTSPDGIELSKKIDYILENVPGARREGTKLFIGDRSMSMQDIRNYQVPDEIDDLLNETQIQDLGEIELPAGHPLAGLLRALAQGNATTLYMDEQGITPLTVEGAPKKHLH